jgi:hypothetical protein
MTVVMILAMVLCANLGDTMLKRGMNQIGAVELSRAGLVHALRLTVTKGTLWIGILFLIAFTASYMAVTSWADYSYVMPPEPSATCSLPSWRSSSSMKTSRPPLDLRASDLHRGLPGEPDETPDHRSRAAGDSMIRCVRGGAQAFANQGC